MGRKLITKAEEAKEEGKKRVFQESSRKEEEKKDC